MICPKWQLNKIFCYILKMVYNTYIRSIKHNNTVHHIHSQSNKKYCASRVENIMGCLCPYLLVNVFMISYTTQRYHVALIELNYLRIFANYI